MPCGPFGAGAPANSAAAAAAAAGHPTDVSQAARATGIQCHDTVTKLFEPSFQAVKPSGKQQRSVINLFSCRSRGFELLRVGCCLHVGCAPPTCQQHCNCCVAVLQIPGKASLTCHCSDQQADGRPAGARPSRHAHAPCRRLVDCTHVRKIVASARSQLCSYALARACSAPTSCWQPWSARPGLAGAG